MIMSFCKAEKTPTNTRIMGWKVFFKKSKVKEKCFIEKKNHKLPNKTKNKPISLIEK